MNNIIKADRARRIDEFLKEMNTKYATGSKWKQSVQERIYDLVDAHNEEWFQRALYEIEEIYVKSAQDHQTDEKVKQLQRLTQAEPNPIKKSNYLSQIILETTRKLKRSSDILETLCLRGNDSGERN